MSEAMPLPCPFCGSDKIEKEAGDESVYYRCRACEGRSGRAWFPDDADCHVSEARALEAWNRRTPTPQGQSPATEETR